MEAAIFDYGGVLCRPPSEEVIGEFAALAGLPPAEFWKLYCRTRDPYDRGVVSARGYWDLFAKEAGLHYTDAQAAALNAMDLKAWRNMDPAMMGLVGDLRKAGVKTAILSNMQPDLLAVLRAEADWLDAFDATVFSCDTGHIKPEAEIYRLAVDAVGVEPGRAFFIDDLPRNIDGARRAGLNGVVYRTFPELRRSPELERALGATNGSSGHACLG